MNICILGSGRGSNCQAILQAFQDQKEQNCKISAVFSDNEDARILNIANSHGIDAKYLPMQHHHHYGHIYRLFFYKYRL